MSDSPPSLRETLSGGVGLAAAVMLVLFALYAVLFAGQVLVVVWLALVAFSLWLLYRFVVAHERVAAAQERRADADERRARAAGSGAGVERGDTEPVGGGPVPGAADRVAEADEDPFDDTEREEDER